MTFADARGALCKEIRMGSIQRTFCILHGRLFFEAAEWRSGSVLGP